MASLVLSGDTSGSITVSAPAIAGSTTQTLVANSGTLAPIVSGTSATASGTAVDFTGIPSWVKRVTVMFNGVSTGGTQLFLVQLGDSGGIEATGYTSGAGSRTSETSRTDGFVLNPAGSAGSSFTGIIQICNFSSLTWVTSGVLSRSDGFANSFGGSKTLSDTLTQVRITTVSPADTFDLGSFNILYE